VVARTDSSREATLDVAEIEFARAMNDLYRAGLISIQKVGILEVAILIDIALVVLDISTHIGPNVVVSIHLCELLLGYFGRALIIGDGREIALRHTSFGTRKGQVSCCKRFVSLSQVLVVTPIRSRRVDDMVARKLFGSRRGYGAVVVSYNAEILDFDCVIWTPLGCLQGSPPSQASLLRSSVGQTGL
jgi:hypothetical protein